MDIEKHFEYFERAVLNYYRTNSHAYHLQEDDMGGELKVSDSWVKEMENEFPYIELGFGFRKLSNGLICIAIFMPSFKDKVSKKDYSKWFGFHIDKPSFNESNERFSRWSNRYINGSWEVDDGPKIQIEGELKRINSLTRIKLNLKFFKHEQYRLVNYPVAENNEEYTKSILELYRLIIDSMNLKCIIKMAQFLNIQLDKEPKRLNSLKKILPLNMIETIHVPLKNLSKKRNPIHGIPSKGIVQFAAFETFNNDLISINNSLCELRIWIESLFNLNADKCSKKLDSLSLFPKLILPPNPIHKKALAEKMIGKTIEKIEYGVYKPHENVHFGEAMNIYFNDGTAVCIEIGSNAYNIYSDTKLIKPFDFHTDLNLFWAE